MFKRNDYNDGLGNLKLGLEMRAIRTLVRSTDPVYLLDYGGRTLEEVSSSKDWSNQRMRLGVCSHSDRVAMGRSGGKHS